MKTNAEIVKDGELIYSSVLFDSKKIDGYTLTGEPLGSLNLEDVKKYNASIVAVWNVGTHLIAAWLKVQPDKVTCACGCKHFRIILHVAGAVDIECVECNKKVTTITARQV